VASGSGKKARTLKRVFLELGGKSAKIVLDDVPNFAQEIAASILVFTLAGLRGPIAAAGVRKRYAEGWKSAARPTKPSDKWGVF